MAATFNETSGREVPGRGPGRYERKGLTLTELFQMFPSDEAAEEWFIEHRWPDGVRCPRCGSDNVLDGTSHKTMRYRCRPCNRFFSPKLGSLMEGSNLGYQKWVVAIYLVTTSLKGVSSMRLHRDLGVTQRTAWFMLHRIRAAWTQTGGELFEGPVEIDETFVGGRARNMHAARRREVIQGRGAVGKCVVVGAKDRATGRVAAKVVPSTRGSDLVPFVHKTVARGAAVFTDEHGAYSGLHRAGFQHATVTHGAGEYVYGSVHVQGVESLWSLFKRGYHGTYHHMSPKHLQRYVDEFVGRHNVRPLDTKVQMGSVVAGMVGKRLTYTELTGKPEKVPPREPF